MSPALRSLPPLAVRPAATLVREAQFDTTDFATAKQRGCEGFTPLLGRLADVGMALRDQAGLAALTEDVLKTSESR